MTTPVPDLRERLTAAIRAAASPEPEAWEENFDWRVMADAALAVLEPALAAERERCAKVAEEHAAAHRAACEGKPYDERVAAQLNKGAACRKVAAVIRALDPSAPADPWRPIDTAPKDGAPILWFGRWKQFDILKGGGPATIIVRWSTIMSDGTGYQWITEGLSTPEQYNVEWTHWMPLPPPPSAGAR